MVTTYFSSYKEDMMEYVREWSDFDYSGCDQNTHRKGYGPYYGDPYDEPDVEPLSDEEADWKVADAKIGSGRP